MVFAMVGLAFPGALLLFLGPALARMARRGRDARGLARILQAVGVALIVAALLVRPSRPELDPENLPPARGVAR